MLNFVDLIKFIMFNIANKMLDKFLYVSPIKNITWSCVYFEVHLLFVLFLFFVSKPLLYLSFLGLPRLYGPILNFKMQYFVNFFFLLPEPQIHL